MASGAGKSLPAQEQSGQPCRQTGVSTKELGRASPLSGHLSQTKAPCCKGPGSLPGCQSS